MHADNPRHVRSEPARRFDPGGDTVNQRRKLIEVALPLDAINRESAREKSIRHGHPSTLHLWWARLFAVSRNPITP